MVPGGAGIRVKVTGMEYVQARPLSVRRPQTVRRMALAGLIVLGFMAQADAASLFRWTDAEGRVHFGDRPPPAEVPEVEELGMPAFAAPELTPDQDPYSILNQLGRLQENRRRLERERREKAWREREYQLRQRELEARERAAEAAQAGAVSGYLRPVYPWYPGYRPGRPGHRPGHPDYRTPHRRGLWKQPDHPAYRPPGYHPPARPGRGVSVDLRR